MKIQNLSSARRFVPFVGLALSVAGAASAQTFTAFTPFFKQVVVNGNVQTFNGPATNTYFNLPGAGPGDGAFGIVVGQGTLISVRFNAESQCSGGGTDAGWCGLRVMIDGVEAAPAAADFAFDSTNDGNRGTASWQAHTMERHRCVPNNGVTRIVPVQVQARIFSSDTDTTAPSFRLDDWSLVIESSTVQSCATSLQDSLKAIPGL